MLKALFGTAVVSDVTQLHNLFDELQSNQENIVHSCNRPTSGMRCLLPLLLP